MSKPNETTTPNSTELDEAQLAEVSGGVSSPRNRLGNFEIQDLMSRYNQAETLASSVQKKLDETNNGVISKIG